MIRRSLSLAIILIASLFALSSCSQNLPGGSNTPSAGSPTAISRPATPQQRAAVPSPTPRTLVFPSSNCEVPCWQGITPGTTTITDTIKVLGNPDYDERPYWPEGHIFPVHWGKVWRFNYRGELVDVPQVAMLFERGIVQRIEITDPDSSETLADIAAKYGPPEYVSLGALHDEAQYYHVGLFYPSRGIIFASKYASLAGRRETPGVSKRDLVLWKIFIQPTTIEGLQENKYYQHGSAPFPGSTGLSSLIQWKDIPD
jgi:hypothetical protein